MTPQTSLSLFRLGGEDADKAARLHRRAFPDSFLTLLGVEAVRRYYRWLLTGPHECFSVGISSDGKLAAYAMGGAFKGAVSGFVKKNRRFLFCRLLVSPRAWVQARFLRKVLAPLIRLLGKRDTKPRFSIFEDSFGVLVLAVDPEFQRTGLGRRLMGELAKEARHRGKKQMHLSVDKNNHQALFFHRKLGWVLSGAVDDGGQGLLMTKKL